MTPALKDNLSEESIESIRCHNSLPFIGDPDDIAHAEDRRSLLPDDPAS